jgi:hypothetical protein
MHNHPNARQTGIRWALGWRRQIQAAEPVGLTSKKDESPNAAQAWVHLPTNL